MRKGIIRRGNAACTSAGGPTPGAGVGWQILPYCEENEIYQQGGIPFKTLAASGVMDRQIKTFLCPSDPTSAAGPKTDAGHFEGIAVGQTNYKGCSGANWARTPRSTPWTSAPSSPIRARTGRPNGMNDGDGILWRCDVLYHLNERNVTDGLSHTFLAGEVLPAKDTWTCWPYANDAYATCAIPPNFTYQDPNWWPNTHSFRSMHPAGLNFSMADGAIRFVSEDIDLTLYRALATPPGNWLAIFERQV